MLPAMAVNGEAWAALLAAIAAATPVTASATTRTCSTNWMPSWHILCSKHGERPGELCVTCSSCAPRQQGRDPFVTAFTLGIFLSFLSAYIAMSLQARAVGLSKQQYSSGHYFLITTKEVQLRDPRVHQSICLALHDPLPLPCGGHISAHTPPAVSGVLSPSVEQLFP